MVCAIGAQPIGAPGCPLLAACTVSMARVRIVVTADWSRRGSMGLSIHNRQVGR